jgi:hypothetical protein
MMSPAETVAAEILAERRRQIEDEGFTPDRDDRYGRSGQLALAAAAYAFHVAKEGAPTAYWPWHPDWWKPTTPRRDLVKAAALIIADIERMDRAYAYALTCVLGPPAHNLFLHLSILPRLLGDIPGQLNPNSPLETLVALGLAEVGDIGPDRDEFRRPVKLTEAGDARRLRFAGSAGAAGPLVLDPAGFRKGSSDHA